MSQPRTSSDSVAAPRAGSTTGPPLPLADFNRLNHNTAVELLRPCLDVGRWLSEIGQRPVGTSAEAALSRAEQGGLNLDQNIEQRLAAGNRAYEERFGRVFLIRAAGRSSQEILQTLDRRLRTDPETEDQVVAAELRQIALLRLANLVSS